MMSSLLQTHEKKKDFYCSISVINTFCSRGFTLTNDNQNHFLC